MKAAGVEALIHGNQGRKPAHAVTEGLKERIVTLKLSDTYKGANFKHYQELLAKRESINASYSLIHRLLTEANITSPKKRRRFKPHRRRSRKAQEGLMIQMDASPFQWLGGRSMYSLHGGIDDATGKIAGLYMTKHECMQGYFETTRQILLNHGIPVSIYSDRHATVSYTHLDVYKRQTWRDWPGAPTPSSAGAVTGRAGPASMARSTAAS